MGHSTYLKILPRDTPEAAAAQTWAVHDLCIAYDWPSNMPGNGVIAIVELAGGYLMSDVEAYCAANGVPVPSITDVSIGGVQNDYEGGGDANFEVALDIQVTADSFFRATGRPATIRVYFAKTIGDAVNAAAKDGCAVFSCSWGSDEADWRPGPLQTMQSVALAATEKGMTLFAAAGDNDSSDGGDTPANVDGPASCPRFISCGGTTKTVTSETVWNNNPGVTDGSGTGGGFSTVFSERWWQKGAPKSFDGKTVGRMVPDLAANADPNTGYRIVVAGKEEVVGGTSAVAPLMAGLFASFSDAGLGFVTDKLYGTAGLFADVTEGNNGFYSAAVGPDPCSGLGVPIGGKIAAALVRDMAEV